MSEVLIIGGGVAGISAGIYSLLQGDKVTVCEKQGRLGGNLTGWKREGHTIDNCIHWLTGTNPVTSMYKMWTELGALGNVAVPQTRRLFTAVWGGQSLSLWRDFSRTIDEMLMISPMDCREVLEFGKAVHNFRRIQKTGGKNRDERESIIRMVTGMPQLLKYHLITTKQLADKFHHPLLQLFFKGLMGEDFSALAFIMVAAVYTGGNGDVPEGGSIAMAERMERRFLALGGKELLNKEAVKINVKGDRAESVSFSDGSVIKADSVIVTTDPETVFEGRLLDLPMPRELKKQYESELYKRFSAYHCAFACSTDRLPFEGELVVEIPPELQCLLKAPRVMIREYSYLRNGCPEGEATLQTMAFIHEEECREFLELSKNKEAYQSLKQNIGELLMKLVEDTCPSLKGKLRCIDVWTPATYKRYTCAEMGSFMGFVMPPRILPKALDVKIKGLSNVLMASQWLQAPGGLPVAAISGKRAAESLKSLSKS